MSTSNRPNINVQLDESASPQQPVFAVPNMGGIPMLIMNFPGGIVIMTPFGSQIITNKQLVLGNEMERLGYRSQVITSVTENVHSEVAINTFYLACFHQQLNLVKLLIEYGANVNAANVFGIRGLHGAIVRGHLDIVQYLVEHGANIDAGNPLKMAAIKGHVDIAKYLIEQGATVDYKNEAIKTIIKAMLPDKKVQAVFLDKVEKVIDDYSMSEPKNKQGFFAGQPPRDLREAKNEIARIKNDQCSSYDGLSRIIYDCTRSHNYPRILDAAKECREILAKVNDKKCSVSFGNR